MRDVYKRQLLMQSAAGKTEKSFQAESLKIGIADEDGGTFALALRTYLDNFHEVIPLENDISVMQEKLFYRDVEYIVRIPENFYQKCIQGGERLPVTTVPDTYSGIYVDQQINSFLNNARTVSYTHLDVYKRQHLLCGQCRQCYLQAEVK